MRVIFGIGKAITYISDLHFVTTDSGISNFIITKLLNCVYRKN
ncbi:MAG: hypothetical protein OFPII_27670 [Osedax symbiont Rs1]|nr:MAG: hypothetical protein OFPII_27670 [Osedax symbiont Rs1]